ncbi:MAG: GntR family transcriptional regulator, partial [Candidatus Nanopelagicales bacterium]
MVRRGDSQTLSVDAYAQLRSDLLAGQYSPGERLVPAELADRYGVGPGVLREALGRLASEQLGTIEPNRGFRVLDASRARIEDLLGLRRIAEGAALRLSVDKGDADHQARVLAAHHRLRSAAADTEDGRRAHRDFHLELLSACGNTRLLDLCEELFDASELYRRWSVAALARPRRGTRAADS